MRCLPAAMKEADTVVIISENMMIGNGNER